MDIDLNADLGEGAGFDAELIPLVTSANVCCGLHAGGPAEMAATLDLAKRYGVTIGAHPGYDDREHFGRRERIVRTAQDQAALIESLTRQIQSLEALAQERGLTVNYVKPHGALYNQACRDEALATIVAIGMIHAQRDLKLVGLPGSKLSRALLPEWFIPEGFADRRYRPDGSLMPRTEPDAFVHDPDEAVKQVEWLIREKGVRTICVHGDNPQAVAFTKAVRSALLARGFTLKPFA